MLGLVAFLEIWQMKQRLVNFLALMAYWCGIDALFYKLNRKSKRIITFHNVLPNGLFKRDLTNGVSDSETSFRSIIREVGKRFPYSVDIEDSGSVTITFDDGFLNQYEVAGRILQEEGDIPAIIFAAGDVLDNRIPTNVIVVDRLLHWTAYAPSGEYDFPYCKERKIILSEHNRGKIWMKYIRPAYIADSDGRGANVMGTLDAQYAMDRILDALPAEYRRLRLTGISSAQAEELRRRGWKIGWHTKSHYPLSSLRESEKRLEIAPPDGFKDVVFSYPYGETLSVDAEAIEIAQECGYPCAVSNLPTENYLTGKYFLPRMALPYDKYRLHFRLSGLESYIKTRKLLPVAY